ncbi:sulfide:quinone oxidoreductase [Austwickia chelonae]|uniref:Putative FAD-dependent pyridine nucleotide-disulphide oxidoreductase n=1 Tax=Austwickia chelonae NBRC 105200 TaxID=1184607 RepID=K6VRD6_9MICO|nr:FAD/NAD(P)-binding oxidoreductase [Austwickia chelonae]GAB79324.1 putative FAD-dependent pyridine nucleotide-disulphide oxidoreductase [Austwickia chelonae NBRC 105200]SEW38310.1 sulfide:quinone oxidoreductase [Austwickia chelonae]
MRHLVILGGGTAGTMAANKLRRKLLRSEWSITVVDRDDQHHYQPGYLFVPFGTYTRQHVVRSRHAFINDGINLVLAPIDRVDPQTRAVHLADGRELPYDQLVIATGCTPRPELTPGLAEALQDESDHGKVHEFYTLPGALALHEALSRFTGGRLVVHLNELPVKCPVAPLEFAFLADEYLTKRGLRERSEIVYITPLDGAFTKATCSKALGYLLEERGITLETDFFTERVDQDGDGGAVVSYDDRRVPFDLLVTVPINTGQEWVTRSGLGDDMAYVPTDKHTLRSREHPDIWVLGDASDIPTSKAGSVAHFAVDTFERNFLDALAGRPLISRFDGHANCFIESGYGKALLIDFNYDTEPLPGTFPMPKVGPMKLLKETRANHLGKLAFRHIYWNILLPGRPLPIGHAMSMRGKDTSAVVVPAAPPVPGGSHPAPGAAEKAPIVPDF